MEYVKSNCGFNRKRGYVEMLPQNEQDLQKFVAERRRNECSENTLRMYVGLISEFEEQFNKPFRDITEEDVNTFIDRKSGYSKKGTMATTKMVIKAFYRWLFDLRDSYPPCVEKLEVNGRQHNGNGDAIHLEARGILTKDDVATLIKCADQYNTKERKFYAHHNTWINRLTNFDIIDLFIFIHHRMSPTAFQVKNRPCSVIMHTYFLVFTKKH